MADAKKRKRKIQASEVEVGNRTLEGVLIDLADEIKANDARFTERVARVEERIARAEEHTTIALQTIAAVTQDLRALTQEVRGLSQEVRGLSQDLRVLTHETRTFNTRTDGRLDVLETAVGIHDSRV